MKQDKLYKKAKKIVEKTNNYSISHLQRKLQVGYNRASDLMKEILQK